MFWHADESHKVHKGAFDVLATLPCTSCIALTGTATYYGKVGLEVQLDWATPGWRGPDGSITILDKSATRTREMIKDYLYCDQVLSVTKHLSNLPAGASHRLKTISLFFPVDDSNERFLAALVCGAQMERGVRVERKLMAGEFDKLDKEDVCQRLCQASPSWREISSM